MSEKDISYEENVITPEEFEEIEKKEKGKKYKPVPKPVSAAKKQKETEPTNFETLLLKIEKLEGKLEATENMIKATEEKIAKNTEEIGELRSSILERDRVFNRIESDFRLIKELSEEIKPQKIKKELEKKEEAILKNEAKIEKIETKLSVISKDITRLRQILEKIKNLENLINVSKNINKKISVIEKQKRESDKLASKIETVFSEISEMMAEFNSYKENIDFNDEALHEIVKSVDMLEAKLEKMVKKDDLEKFNEKIKEMKDDYTGKIQDMKDIVSELVFSIKNAGLKSLLSKQGEERLKEIMRALNEIKELKEKIKEMEKVCRGLKSLKEVPVKQSDKKEIIKEEKVEEIKTEEPETNVQKLEKIINTAYEQIDKGDIEGAKQNYMEALSLYNTLKDSESPEILQKLYNEIKNLHFRLSIYTS